MARQRNWKSRSRNTAQKQWDEALLLVLGGISRLFCSFFPFLRSLNNFLSEWESLLLFVENSILLGSEEIALAAISCLQTSILSHSSKGNFLCKHRACLIFLI